MSTLIQDLKYGLRMLARNPGFTAVAVLTLALGIGANTAIFSMVNGILLRSLHYRQPKRLYTINEVVPQWSRYAPYFPVRGGNFLLWQRRCPAFSGMTEFMTGLAYNLTGGGHPALVRAARVSTNFFSLLGIRPQRGRDFLPVEDQPGRGRKVILTHTFWQQTFDSDPSMIGKAINLDGKPYTVIGVLPASFRFPKPMLHGPQVFVPIVPRLRSELKADIGTFNFNVIGRLKPGVTPGQALAQLNTVEAQIARKVNSTPGGAPETLSLHAMLRPLKTVVVGRSQEALWMLLAAAGFVLLIICVNLANLTLVKNERRRHELALRSALGATRRRLAGQLLAEGAILVAAGGALGVLLAEWGLQFLILNAPLGIPRIHQARLDARVLVFTLAISAVAVLLFALLPALRLSRIQPAETLKSAGPTSSGGKASERLRGVLVAAEIALSAVVLAGVLLMVRSLIHVLSSTRWMNESRVLALNVVPPPNQYENSSQRDRFFSAVLGKVEGLPGVKSAGFVNKLPLQGPRWGDNVVFREEPRTRKEMIGGDFRFVTPGYFQSIGLPLQKGRLLSSGDRGKDVALISQGVARRVLPGRDPIGMHLDWRGKSAEVIGVVGNVSNAPDKAPVLAVYLPTWTFTDYAETLVVRAEIDPGATASAVRRAVWSVDSQVAIPREETLQNIVKSTTAPRRYETLLATLFAACAVLLAALGLYGVVSYSIAQRTHEIGIRMALGAEKRDVLRMVVGQGIKLALIGVAIGTAGAFALTRFLASLLYGVKPTDPLTFIAVSLILVAVALAACYIPARRAAHVDPMEALRYE